MPTAVISLVGVLASVMGGGAVATAIAGVVVYGALSVGFSYLSSLLMKKPSPKPSEMKTVIKQPAAARRRSYGLTMVGGVLVMVEENGPMLGMVIATGQGRINRVVMHYLDNRPLLIDTVGRIASYPYKGLSILTATLGENIPMPHAYIAQNFFWAWGFNHLGRDVNSVGIIAIRDEAKNFNLMFPNGANIAYKQLREGALVYDPRTRQTAYSDNAALCIRDFLISEYGMRLPESIVSIADQDWIEAANICDEIIPLKSGLAEVRYRIAMTYQLDETPSSVLRRMLNACDAEIFPTPEGGITIKVGKWKEPTVTLNEEAITGINNLTKGADVLSRYNTIRAQYTSPFHEYEEVDADPWVDEESVTLYGESAQDLQFYESPSHGQTRRLMKRAFYAMTAGTRMTITTNLRGLAVFGERFIRVKIEEFGIDESFEIQGQPGCIFGDNGAIIGVELELIAISGEAFSWNPARDEGNAPNSDTEVAPAYVIPSPTGFVVRRDRRILSGTDLSWALLEADVPINSNYIRYEISIDEGKTWKYVYGNEYTAKAEYGPLTDDVTYLFRARTVTPAETAESEPTASVTLENVSTPELVTNGGFSYDGDWEKDEGWQIAFGQAIRNGETEGSIWQKTKKLVAGRSYIISFTLATRNSGSVQVFLEGNKTVFGTIRETPGDYVETLIAPENTTSFGVIASEEASAMIDNISIKEVV